MAKVILCGLGCVLGLLTVEDGDLGVKGKG